MALGLFKTSSADDARPSMGRPECSAKGAGLAVKEAVPDPLPSRMCFKDALTPQ